MSATDSALAVVDTPAVDAVDSAVETPTTVPDATGDSTVEDTSTETQTTTDSKPEAVKAEDSKEGKAETKADQTADSKALPKDVSNLLTKLQESNKDNPNVAKLVKSIRDEYFRAATYRESFSSASEAKQASTIIKSLGGLQQLQEYVQSIEESDNLLVAGDPKLVDNIVDDLKASDSIAALDKLTPAFMSKWSAENPKAYSAYMQKTISTALKTSGLHSTLEAIWKTELTPSARKEVKSIANWLERVEKNASSFETETKQQTEAQTKAQQAEISKLNVSAGESAEKSSNLILGRQLGKLRGAIPALKALTLDQLQIVGVEIKKSLHQALRDENSQYQQKIDKLYQNGKGLLNPKTFDTIQEIHAQTVESLKEKLVRDAIRKSYPNISLDTKPKPAALAYKTYTKAEVQGWSKNQPLPKADRVATKPKDLARDLDDGARLEILGRGFVPVAGGKYRLVSWR